MKHFLDENANHTERAQISLNIRANSITFAFLATTNTRGIVEWNQSHIGRTRANRTSRPILHLGWKRPTVRLVTNRVCFLGTNLTCGSGLGGTRGVNVGPGVPGMAFAFVGS